MSEAGRAGKQHLAASRHTEGPSERAAIREALAQAAEPVPEADGSEVTTDPPMVMPDLSQLALRQASGAAIIALGIGLTLAKRPAT